MAVLADGDRVALWVASNEGQTMALTKANLRAAVNGLDDFLDTNAAAINLAIPQPARNALSTPQKALLLQFVISRRYLAGV